MYLPASGPWRFGDPRSYLFLVAHVARTIEVGEPVEVIYEEWTRFEGLPRRAAPSLDARVRWRAEVLTLEPIPLGTRLTLRVDYDPGPADAALPTWVDRMLASFRSFVTQRVLGTP